MPSIILSNNRNYYLEESDFRITSRDEDCGVIPSRPNIQSVVQRVDVFTAFDLDKEEVVTDKELLAEIAEAISESDDSIWLLYATDTTPDHEDCLAHSL